MFAAFAVVGGWLLVEGLGALRSRRREGVAWMALGVLVIAMGGTIVIAL